MKLVKVLLYIRTKTSLLGQFNKLNCLDDLIYITTEWHVRSQQKCMSKMIKRLRVKIIKSKMFYSESGPDSNFAINSASNYYFFWI